MEDRRAIKFDNKIPLTWLLTSGGGFLTLLLTVLWNVAGQNSKLDQLVVQAEKAERRNAERDIKLETMLREQYDNKRMIEVIGVRVEGLEKAKAK